MDEWRRGYRIPYVHGLTIGEIATMAATAPGVLRCLRPSARRANSRSFKCVLAAFDALARDGSHVVATSPKVQDFAACVGYSMTGIGCEMAGSPMALETSIRFVESPLTASRLICLLKELEALHLPGLAFHKVSCPTRRGSLPPVFISK